MFLRHPVFMSSLFTIKTFLAELSKELHELQTQKNQAKELVCVRLSHNMLSNTARKPFFLNKWCENSQKIVKMCCPYLNTLVSGNPIIKAIRIEKLAYQGECRRLLLGGLPWGKHSAKHQGRTAHLRRKGVFEPKLMNWLRHELRKAHERLLEIIKLTNDIM